MSKISVIGAGSVGATIANDLMIQGIASEIVLVDINTKKALGEALDVYQGAPFNAPAVVRAGDYSDTDLRCCKKARYDPFGFGTDQCEYPEGCNCKCGKVRT